MTQVIDAALAAGTAYFREKNWEPFPFQLETWRAYLRGESGLLNAPTGSGKTYALWMPALLRHKVQWDQNPEKSAEQGLKVLWITPLRALGQDIQLAMQRVCSDLDFPWRVEVRNGDSSSSVKQAQKKRPPECLVTTPETVHLLLSQANHQKFFANLEAVIVDEWHELMGNKRGVQIQLALAYLKAFCCPQLQTWGISATVGNLEEAMWILNGSQSGTLVRAQINKQLDMHTIYPEELEKYPWAGHLGIKLIDRVIPLIERYRTVLLFTNTRAQSEIWYQKLMELRPDWAGLVAVHHGSLDREVRAWVEEQLHGARLRLVVCTSSLDLGVDFRPVEAVIQIGSQKAWPVFSSVQVVRGIVRGWPAKFTLCPLMP
ncbi:DEAD/DEAH box helicase [Nitritalea halalkaliphila]|uniref:DEAD/DEAH box helicase n=1 Tax=Nitritalea halalkaliphila TaxID=590849 RepID=UPI0002D6B3EB|nr:DEAD/DEAH box helicase [Nitritalea halalkaliphila]